MMFAAFIHLSELTSTVNPNAFLQTFLFMFVQPRSNRGARKLEQMRGDTRAESFSNLLRCWMRRDGRRVRR